MEQVEVTRIRAEYEKVGFLGIVAFIDFLEQNRREGQEIYWIGSRTVSFHKLISHCSLEEQMALPAYGLGDRDGSYGPMQILADALTDENPDIAQGLILLNILCTD